MILDVFTDRLEQTANYGIQNGAHRKSFLVPKPIKWENLGNNSQAGT